MAKSIVGDMLDKLKLDGNNYASRNRKINYLLSEIDAIDFITRKVTPQRGTSAAEVQWYV